MGFALVGDDEAIGPALFDLLDALRGLAALQIGDTRPGVWQPGCDGSGNRLYGHNDRLETSGRMGPLKGAVSSA